MKKFRGSFLSAVAFAAASFLARADIAPTEFIGSGIAARPESAIRMEKAVVEIVWGTPCSLSATFKMMNSSGAPQAIRVGFPMPASEDDVVPTKAPDDLTIAFDGEVAVVVPPSANMEDRDRRRDWVWFHCQHTFKPGVTTVEVKTPLRASRVYSTAFQEALFYCIQTGGNWGGTIGKEEVAIRFPQPLEKDQIVRASPAGYKIEGNCVRWRFTDFKPKGTEYDIALTYVRPDVERVLSAMRRAVDQQPESSPAAVKLAKHLLVLGHGKSNSGFPPSELSKEQHSSIASNIAEAGARKIFLEHYRMTAEGGYEETSSEWTKERLALVQILADAGYRDQSSQSPFILEAEQLLKNVLARDPHDALAWNVYLASYWRFSFAAVGHWFGTTRLSKAQAKLIETAAENCPNDESIQVWLDLRRNGSEKRDTTALFEAIKRSGFMNLEFPQINYGYY